MGNSRNRQNDAQGPMVPKGGESGRKKFKRGPSRPRVRGNRDKAPDLPAITHSQVVDHLIMARQNHKNEHPSKWNRSWKKHGLNKVFNETTENLHNVRKITHCDSCPGRNEVLIEQGRKPETIQNDIQQIDGVVRCVRCMRWWRA